MEKRFPDDKTWNVAPADTPHKIRFQPALMSLDSTKLVVDSVRAGYDDIEAGSFASLLKSRRKSDRVGAHCCCRRATYDLGCVKVISRWSNPTQPWVRNSCPRISPGFQRVRGPLRERARQFERAIVMTGHCVRCLCQTAPRPRPSRGRSDGKRPGPAMAAVRLFSAGAHAPLHRETK